MNSIFGEVAALYDRSRPEYASHLAEVVLDYATDPPAGVTEIGAGTGKGTALFAGRGFPLTCLEPDARMSDLLVFRFPEVTVAPVRFEEWQPPAGGVDLLFAALAWHWLNPRTRAALAADALAPGGTLALLDRTSRHTDERLGAALHKAYEQYPPASPERRPLPEWAVPELAALPALTDVTVWDEPREVVRTADEFLAQLQTLSPFRRRTPENRRSLLNLVRQTLAAHGGEVRTRTTFWIVLARKRAGR